MVTNPSSLPATRLNPDARPRRSSGQRAAFALLAVALLAAQGCKKEEEAAPTPAPAPAPKPAAAAPATGAPAGAAAGAAAAVKPGTNAPAPGAPAPATGAADTVDLRLNWPVGKRFLQRMDIVQSSESTIPGVPTAMKQDSTQSQDYSITVVKEREGGGRELELEFIAQKIDSQMGGKPLVAFDSKADAKTDRTNAVAGAMRKLVGVKIHYLTDTNGRIDKVVGAQELQTRLTAAAAPQARMILTGLLNEDNLKRVVTLAIGLPDKPVKVGETWAAQRDVPMGLMGTLLMDSKYTFKGWEEHDKRRCALLESTGTIASKPGGPTGPTSMTVESGKTAGKAWFDPAAGMIIDSSMDQEMTMKVSSGGQNIESKTKTKINVKVVEATDAPKTN